MQPPNHFIVWYLHHKFLTSDAKKKWNKSGHQIFFQIVWKLCVFSYTDLDWSDTHQNVHINHKTIKTYDWYKIINPPWRYNVRESLVGWDSSYCKSPTSCDVVQYLCWLLPCGFKHYHSSDATIRHGGSLSVI